MDKCFALSALFLLAEPLSPCASQSHTETNRHQHNPIVWHGYPLTAFVQPCLLVRFADIFVRYISHLSVIFRVTLEGFQNDSIRGHAHLSHPQLKNKVKLTRRCVLQRGLHPFVIKHGRKLLYTLCMNDI